MITASLLLNIIVLVPVCFGLSINSERMEKTAGVFTPARGILLSIYLTIAIASLALLFIEEVKFVFALLSLQVVYKIMTPITVKTLKNPIVISNLLIAAFHLVTIFKISRAGVLEI
ncbi:hypothetical protein [Tunicatimonas pelagia]|uniref:hypothetical protein n=1 Tax=Tunicatimonas pelagia TaxID=931531 RepID=UPI002666AD03|nr:hypothetical protein [Tunicatimonas pelagia]WKN40519.1 hypothetical protein P0M28_15875 [Tunicatimonas pelagia]